MGTETEFDCVCQLVNVKLAECIVPRTKEITISCSFADMN